MQTNIGGDEDRHPLQVLFESTASECRRIVESLSLLREYVRSIQEVGRVESESSLSRLRNISASLQSACVHVPQMPQSTQQHLHQLQPNAPLESATLLDDDEMPPLELPVVRPRFLEPTATAPHLRHPQEILTQERAKGKTFKKQQVVGRRY